MISNASPLINFAKLNKLALLIKSVGTLIVSEKVLGEVVQKEGYSQESELIREQIEQTNVRIKRLNAAYSQKAVKIRTLFRGLGLGESETIALALQEGQDEVLIDDLLAREAAKLNGLKPIGSLRVLLIAFEKRVIGENEVTNLFKQMAENKFWVSGEVALKFMELFEKTKAKKKKRK